MTYAELVKQVKKTIKISDKELAKNHFAVEFDIQGDGEGAFYVEFLNGKVDVEPYEYYDYDIRIRTDAQTALELTGGTLDFEKALLDGRLSAEGKVDRLASLGMALKHDSKKIEKKPEPKKLSKKAEPKKISKKPASKSIGTKKATKSIASKKAVGRIGTK
ncbi:MAG: SCP2 sterol-binding domain-containing protein [Lachnospiraceae bacterium]|nr:SCP2 sterol-binding domain-containing protein [Lachnospiraceae bacterium]